MSAWQAVGARLARLPSPRAVRAFGAQLRGPHRISACRAVVDGCFVTCALKVRGVRPLVAGVPVSGASRDAERAVAVSAAVDVGLAMLPIAPTCLRRSLTLLREFGRLGIHGELHIGVRTVNGRVEAHAWVQVGGVVVNDDVQLTSGYRELAADRPGDLLSLLR